MFRLFCLLALPTLLLAQAPGPDVKRRAAPYTSPTSGSEMYRAYCASCHGPSGQGNGPVATDLNVGMPDLTRMAQRNQGVFPELSVVQIIRGEGATRAHGNVDMPVWGPVFRTFDGRRDTALHQRVANLTRFLAGLQVR